MKGKYVAAKLSQESVDFIYSMLEYYKIPNLISKDDLHTTIIYSESKPMVGCEYEIDMTEVGTIDSFDVFSDKLLVIKVKSDYLSTRHETLMSDYDGEYDFPEYIPHITVSSDITDFDIPELDDKFKLDIIYNHEYTEELSKSFVYEGLVSSVKDKISFLKDKFKYGGDDELEDLFIDSPIKSKSISLDDLKTAIYTDLKDSLSEEWFNRAEITMDSIHIKNKNKVTFKPFKGGDYIDDAIRDIFRKYFKYVTTFNYDDVDREELQIYFSDDIEELLYLMGYLYNLNTGDMYTNDSDEIVEVTLMNMPMNQDGPKEINYKDKSGNTGMLPQDEFIKKYYKQIKETKSDYKKIKEYYTQIKEQLNLLEK